MRFKEVEFKYNASNITLSEFKEFGRSLQGAVEFDLPVSWDFFYVKDKDPNCFIRHRLGCTINQLTIKRKKDASNSYVREEVNLALSNNAGDEQDDEVKALCNLLGYEPTLKLCKQAFLFVLPAFSLSYYVVFDDNMRENGRFIEIEVNEDLSISSEEQAWAQLITMEKICRPLGLTPLGRIKNSLLELYAKF